MYFAKRFASPVIFRLVLLTLCVAIGAAGLWGQAATGTVTGVITDEQGAVIPAADIKVVETNTGSSRSAQTNESGRFTVVSVSPGSYSITVTKAGFQTSKAIAQKVDIGETLTLNLSMKVGQAATTIEVSATAGAELQTLNATIGSTITNESLQLLPNLGRDASSLAVLQVGVTLTGNVAGAATDQNKFQLDGGNNSDDMAGGNITYTPGNGYSGTSATGGTPTGVIPTPIESIEEFKIGTTGQGADFNGAAGSQVQMVTKRGTNQFHGALYEFYFGSNVGAANLWRNNHVLIADPKNPTGAKIATPLPATHRNRYGLAVGGPMTPKFWGGKTYFFFNYEASRFPNVISFERGVPTDLMKAGVLQLTDASGKLSAYNLNPFAVTVNGKSYDPATCGSGACDPRGIGVNPIVRKLWNTLPSPNDASFTAGSAATGLVDGVNAQGYLGNLSLPQASNFVVGRIDHDFGEKWKFMSSYRYYSFKQLAGTQVDLGGLLPGASQGQYKSYAPRPVKPSYWVAGLTTTISPTLTNDFHFSYLRNFWQWSTQAGPPQFAGLGGAVELGGESQGGALIPYNVDSQDVRQRYWDGHDYFLSDSMSKLKGNHLFQWGGSYQRNNDLHGRDDNGVGINTSLVYQVAGGSAVNAGAYTLPNGAASSAAANYPIMYNEIMGLVSQTQLMYSRSGKNLQLNPIGTPGFDQSIIPSYDAFVTDTWHVKPNLTLSYGLAYSLTMPPHELNGKQVLMVDAAGNPIDIKGYLQNRQNLALQGQVYNPTIGFETINNVQGGQIKYPYNPFYGGFSPHVSLAWNPKFGGGMLDKIFGNGQTVIRGGYGRIFGRLNGVDLLLVPLLGPGLLQAVSCVAPTPGGTCAGAGGLNPTTGFRIGTDGNSPVVPQATATLPQPYFPGTTQNGVLNSTSADGSQLDPKLRPNHSDEFNFTIQRALSSKMVIEAGYIGRTIKHEFQEINIDPIPWMTTLGGQSFAQAWAGVYNQICSGAGAVCTPNTTTVTAQPFFEAVMGGPTSAFCAGSVNCTAAVVKSQVANIKSTNAYNAWVALAQQPSWTLGRTLLAQPGAGQQLSGAFDFINSYGHGSYNAAFFSVTAKDYHGLTARSNFTWGRSLGTGSVVQASSSITVPNPYDFKNFGTYGTQPFDVKFTYSLLMLYQPPVFKAQHGVIGKALGGWAIAPLLTARTGLPQRVSVGSNYGAFGEIYSGQSSNYENAPLRSAFTGTGQAAYNVPIPAGGVASSGSTGVNLFSDPLKVYDEFRRPVLGMDQNSGGAGPIRGFPFWNLDATISKDFKIRESIGATLNFQFVNVLNHFTPADPTTNIDTPSTFGVVTNAFTTPNGAQSRSMEFGLRIRF